MRARKPSHFKICSFSSSGLEMTKVCCISEKDCESSFEFGMQPNIPSTFNIHFHSGEWREKASTSFGNVETTLTRLANRFKQILQFDSQDDDGEMEERMSDQTQPMVTSSNARNHKLWKTKRKRKGQDKLGRNAKSSPCSRPLCTLNSSSYEDEKSSFSLSQTSFSSSTSSSSSWSSSSYEEPGSFPSSNSSSTETAPCNLHQKRSIRAPRIGQLPRRSAFDDADDVIQSRPNPIKPNIDLRNKAPDLHSGELPARNNHVRQRQQLEQSPRCRNSSTLPQKGPDRLANNERGSFSVPPKAQSSSVSSISGIGGESTAIGTMASSQESIIQLQKGVVSNEGTPEDFVQNSKTSSLSNFASVIESTKTLNLNDERQRSPTKAPQPFGFVPTPGRSRPHPSGTTPLIPSPDDEDMVKINPRKVPIPAKCSSQLRRLIHSHSLCQPPVPNPAPPPVQGPVSMAHSPSLPGKGSNDTIRPIFPQLPYSPYASPNSSPRVKRKPLRETTRVNSITESTGEFVQLNQYKLHESLGQGSYGIVKLAYNKEDNSHYAMKILSKKKLKRQGGLFSRGIPNRKAPGGGSRKMAEGPLQKVYREIAIMKKLDHPNVVKLVEVLDDPEDENLYMVFEFLKGGEVLEIPTDRPLDEKAAWLALRDVISGLEYLHYQKIIHRDVKPSNLLRTTDGVVKIADLGVSNEFNGQDDAFLTNSAGTPAFTPPESLSHKPGDDPYSGRRADIWSLGVTLYCLVVGKVPFHDNNILGIHHKIKTQPLSFPEKCDISPELKDLIGRMLKKDPNERASLQEIKVHDWVTGFGLYPLPTEEENCVLVEITETDVDNSVRTVPKLDTLILVKSMLKNHSFLNPFHNLRTRLGVNGRSNSAPEVTFFEDRKLEVTMPMVSEEKHDPSET